MHEEQKGLETWMEGGGASCNHFRPAGITLDTDHALRATPSILYKEFLVQSKLLSACAYALWCLQLLVPRHFTVDEHKEFRLSLLAQRFIEKAKLCCSDCKAEASYLVVVEATVSYFNGDFHNQTSKHLLPSTSFVGMVSAPFRYINSLLAMTGSLHFLLINTQFLDAKYLCRRLKTSLKFPLLLSGWGQ